MTQLTKYEEKIIDYLDARFLGRTTREIAEKIGPIEAVINRASQSSLVLNSLLRLEKRGLVRREPDSAPCVWMLAPRSEHV